MNEEVGSVIKVVARVLMWLGILASIICGISVGVSEDMPLMAIIIIVTGIISSWISSLLMYGFGQLIENTDMMVSAGYDIRRLASSVDGAKKSIYDLKEVTPVEHSWRCDKCGTLTTGETCHNCNAKP